VLLRHPDAAEPDLALPIPHLLQFDASRKVEEVRLCAGGGTFAVGIGESPVENEPGGLDAGLRVFLRGFQLANSGDLLGQHIWFPNPSDFAISIIRDNLTEASIGRKTKIGGGGSRDGAA